MKPEVKQEIKRVTPSMERYLALLPKARRLREIMKVEADVGKLYYPTFALAFNSELGFTSRNSRRTFRPSAANDVINALLNYGFSILYAEIAKQLNALGLDCYVGFYHKTHPSRLPLVYDMIEPFRHLVDRSVFEIQSSIRKRDYIFSRDGIVVLSDELKRRYVGLLTSISDRKRDYEARVGVKRTDGYQRMEEITIMKMKCLALKEYLLIAREKPISLPSKATYKNSLLIA